VAECVKAYPDRIVGFAGVDPSDTGAALKEVQHAIVDLGLSGISLDPHLVRITPDDRRMYPLYELADELEVPVVFTMGPIAGRWTEPNALDVAAEAFPNVNFVGSHACWPQVTELIAVAYRRPNVYLEASIYHVMPGAEPFIEAPHGMLQDQVVYASAFPFNPIAIIDKFVGYGFTDDVLAKVTHINAARLLGLPASA
jgi:predicted TIM-barrel fold metal-dependent hydrolase